MDFSQFESVDNSHERKGGYTLVKEQSFDNLKYRRAVKKQKMEDGTVNETIEGRFYVSNSRWNSMNLDVNGLRQFTAPDGTTILALVSDENASILKLSKKSKDGKKVKNFKSSKFELAIEALGLIDTKKVGENQFLDLESVGTNVTIKRVPVIEAFKLSVGAPKPKAVTPVEKIEAAPVAEQPKAAAHVPAADDWN
jgi:hypothetical protein